ncbi:hypothetical protein KEJ26_06470 [Candidatus Bathyarchaeota archaeon]|nr:hypothetical protein [Candidatus Bathyarchaeota archaeon]
MGRVSKGALCTVQGCGKPAIRSVSMERASSVGLKVEGKRRIYLCEQHWKELKKKTKKDALLEKWRHMA